MKKTMLEKASTRREIKAAINSIGPLAKGALSLVKKTCGKPPACDLCGGELEGFKVEERSVRVAVPAHYRNLRYVVWTGWCAKCNRQVKERVPGVLPRFAASNSLLAQNVMDRYVYGITVGTISARTGLSKSAILSEDERLSEILKPCTDRLLELYRKSPVKGADETTWSCDGQRDCLELLEKEPENREYLKFVPKFVDLLREASEHSEHSGIRAFEHSSIYSLRCSQAQTPKCCSRALNAAKRC